VKPVGISGVLKNAAGKDSAIPAFNTLNHLAEAACRADAGWPSIMSGGSRRPFRGRA